MIRAFLMAAFLLAQQQPEEAFPNLMRELRAVVDEFKEPADGIVFRPLSYWERALIISDDAARFQPTSMREIYAAHQLVAGMIALSKGDVETAAAEFRHGMRLDANQAALFHYALGLSSSFAKDYAAGEKEFGQAAELWPHWASPRTALASIYLNSGRENRAETLLKESLDNSLTDSASAKSRQYLLLAQVFDVQNKPKEAEAALKTAIELDSTNPVLVDYLGVHLLNHGQLKTALGIWKTASGVFREEPALIREIALAGTGLAISGAEAFAPPIRSSLDASRPQLPGGSPYRVYAIQSKTGNLLKFRVDSIAFQPFVALLGPDGKAVAMQQIRSSSFAVLEYPVTAPGTYHLVVCSYSPGETGTFEISVPKH